MPERSSLAAGATLGAIYDGHKAGDEAKDMEAQARQRLAAAQERRRYAYVEVYSAVLSDGQCALQQVRAQRGIAFSRLASAASCHRASVHLSFEAPG